MKYLVIDGNSILNRAFYGIKLLSTQNGQYTNGIYGFLNILYKLQQDINPDVAAIAFDLKGKTFRHQMYADYKGTRKGMPAELASQMPVLKEILGYLGYPIITKEGFEADDILGTVAKHCSLQGDKCFVATGDRDSLQLVDENTTVILATTGQYQNMDIQAVKEKYGLLPNELIDLKALMGDSSDNIPGVKGVGEKTAVSLLQKFGSLDNIYENIDDTFIKKSVREKLTADKDMAYLSKKLGTICCDVELDFSQDFQKKQADKEKAVSLFKSLEMYSMAEKFLSDEENTAEEKKPLLKVEIQDFDKEIKKAIVYFARDKFVAVWEDKVYSCPKDSDCVKEFLQDQTKEKIAFDSKELYSFGFQNGINVKNITFCIKLAAYLQNPAAKSYDFEKLAALSDSEAQFECDDYFAPYAMGVYGKLKDFIENENQHTLLYDIEMPLAEILADMEYTGFGVDKEALKNFGESLKVQMEKDLQTVYDFVGYEFNLNSPKQLGAALFEDLKLPTGKKTKSGYSTNAEVLEGLRKYHPVIDVILNYRTYQKLNSTYVEGMLDKIKEDGRIHSTFNQTETRTGRISSGEPNLQNIPVRTKLGQEIRKFFVAKENCVLADADYSQIELRILAHISGDETMQKAFIADEDIHTKTASEIMKLPMDMVTPQIRSRAKAVNFGIVYGISAFSLSKDVGITVKEADSFIKNYLETFSGVKKYMDDIVQSAKEKGYVETMYHRRRYLPEINNSNKTIQALGARMALNTPIQGTSADIIKIAMIRVYNRLKKENLKSKLILQVHDELIVETEKEEIEKVKAVLQQEMQKAAQLSVPLKADVNIGENWYAAKG